MSWKVEEEKEERQCHCCLLGWQLGEKREVKAEEIGGRLFAVHRAQMERESEEEHSPPVQRHEQQGLSG
jgi:hypothetical protein